MNLLTSLGALLLALASPAATAAAQSSGASESGFILAHGLPSSGGYSVSPANNTADGTLGQFGAGGEATSANYVLTDGVAWMEPAVLGDAPIVVGTRPAVGDRLGGEPVTVFGFNFQAPAAGGLSVEIDDQLAVGTFVVSNVQATTTTPGSTGPYGNAVTPVDVAVTNLNGSGRKTDAFVYTPGLIEEGPSPIAGELTIRMHAGPSDLHFLAMGRNLGLPGLPVAPWGGSLELFANLFVLTSGEPLVNGTTTFVIDVPDAPPLAGAVVEFQALFIASLAPASGAFSNRLLVTLVP